MSDTPSIPKDALAAFLDDHDAVDPFALDALPIYWQEGDEIFGDADGYTYAWSVGGLLRGTDKCYRRVR